MYIMRAQIVTNINNIKIITKIQINQLEYHGVDVPVEFVFKSLLNIFLPVKVLPAYILEISVFCILVP